MGRRVSTPTAPRWVTPELAEGVTSPGNLTDPKGRLAQRKSAAFTRQRPLVRTQYRPLDVYPGQGLISGHGLAAPDRFLRLSDHEQTTNVCSVGVLRSPYIQTGSLGESADGEARVHG